MNYSHKVCVSNYAISSFPVVLAPTPPAPGSSWLSSVPLPSASFSSASSSDDFAAVQAGVLGSSVEYQAVAHWFCSSRGGGGGGGG